LVTSIILEQGAKYGNVNTGYLAIINVDPHDGGTYSCKADDIEQLLMTIVFRGTQSKLEKAQSNDHLNVSSFELLYSMKTKLHV
jgi:hypothetical protein